MSPKVVMKPSKIELDKVFINDYRPLMTLGLTENGREKFFENANDTVLHDNKVRFDPAICEKTARRMVLWMAHYWSCTVSSCVQCHFIRASMTAIQRFTLTPHEAKALHFEVFI